MSALLRVLALWRTRAPLLAAGLLLSLLALACGVALLTLSGRAVAATLTGALVGAGLLVQVLGPARVAARYAERLVTHAATFRALADLRVIFFRGLAGRAAGGLGFRQAGDVLQRLVGDVEALDGLYLRIVLPLAAAILLVPAAGIAAGRISSVAGIAVLLLFAAAAFLLPSVAARAAAGAGRQLAQASAGLRVAALDSLTGLREVRAFGAEARMTALVASRGVELVAAQRMLAGRVAWANAASLLCGQAAVLTVLIVAGASPVASVVACFLLVAAFEPVGALPRAGVAAGSASASAARVLDIAVPDVPPADTRQAAARHQPPLPPGGGLQFDRVSFAWRAGQRPVFDSLTLDLPPGAKAAVLGPSGVGKSTLAALALKIAVPQSGRVLLGGLDMARLPAADIHRHVAWLGQTTHLFDDTIRANLLLGHPGASERELWEALDRAAVGDMVRSLPDRLDSWIGESGARLSGGQGRRIALARTLLQRAPVLILDEPCAGLDAETERAFLTTLFAETSGQTVLLIAHRLTGAERLDRIWRLSSGHAVAAAA